jgi:ribonuclease HII
LAGPVVAGAIILPSEVNFKKDPWLKEIKDSKLLTPETREKLAPLISKWALTSAIGLATVEEIDSINIYHASHLAIRRAIAGLNKTPQHILIDGNKIPKALPSPSTAIVKGDMKCLSIAAASILAKVWRDQRMQELDQTFPVYGFSKHKGYPTPAHKRVIQDQGPSEHHRKSFKWNENLA